MGKLIRIVIVWVVAICVFTGILLSGTIAWFKHGGHPIILALILGVVALIVSGIIGARKERPPTDRRSPDHGLRGHHEVPGASPMRFRRRRHGPADDGRRRAATGGRAAWWPSRSERAGRVGGALPQAAPAGAGAVSNGSTVLSAGRRRAPRPRRAPLVDPRRRRARYVRVDQVGYAATPQARLSHDARAGRGRDVHGEPRRRGRRRPAAVGAPRRLDRRTPTSTPSTSTG